MAELLRHLSQKLSKPSGLPLPVDHGQGFAGFNLVPSESEREASGQLLDAAVGLNPGAACVSSVLLLFQPQV